MGSQGECHMHHWLRIALRWSMLLVLTACAAPATPAGTSPQPQSQVQTAPATPAAPKRIVVSVTSDLPTLRAQMNRAAGGILAGAVELEELVNAGLVVMDDRAQLQP